MAEKRKGKKGGKIASGPMQLTSWESTALRLYRAKEINLEEYSGMVGLKPVKVAKAKDSYNLEEQYTPLEPIDAVKMVPQEVDDDIGSVPPPPPEAPAPPEPAPEADWVMPSPPPDDPSGEEDTEATTRVVQEKGRGETEKHEKTADKCYLWCIRCPLRLATHEITFGQGKIPDWLELEGEKDNPPFIPVCCGQCNREERDECDSREDEEDYVRKGFLYLKFHWDALSEKAREMAAIRAGQGVALFARDGKAAHVDIDVFRSRLRRCDYGETLDLDLFSEDPTGDFGTGKLVGGLF